MSLILQVRKQRFRDEFGQVHTVGKKQSQVAETGNLAPEVK